MIVPAKREAVTGEELVVGKDYNVDSGLGGSNTVRYRGVKKGKHVFYQYARPDWPAQTYSYADEEIPASVYRLVPENSHFRSMWTPGPNEG